jgi:hypothetical protein
MKAYKTTPFEDVLSALPASGAKRLKQKGGRCWRRSTGAQPSRKCARVAESARQGWRMS